MQNCHMVCHISHWKKSYGYKFPISTAALSKINVQETIIKIAGISLPHLPIQFIKLQLPVSCSFMDACYTTSQTA